MPIGHGAGLAPFEPAAEPCPQRQARPPAIRYAPPNPARIRPALRCGCRARRAWSDRQPPVLAGFGLGEARAEFLRNAHRLGEIDEARLRRRAMVDEPEMSTPGLLGEQGKVVEHVGAAGEQGRSVRPDAIGAGDMEGFGKPDHARQAVAGKDGRAGRRSRWPERCAARRSARHHDGEIVSVSGDAE